MDEPIGLAAKRRIRRRIRIELCILVLLIIGAIANVMLTYDPSESKGAIGIVSGTGAELKTVFSGPTELEIRWDNIVGQAWSVSLIEGRIRNVSNKIVSFQDIVYRTKDGDGNIIWEESDSRFTNGGGLEPMQYFNFATNPISGRESKTFEVLVKNSTVSER